MLKLLVEYMHEQKVRWKIDLRNNERLIIAEENELFTLEKMLNTYFHIVKGIQRQLNTVSENCPK